MTCKPANEPDKIKVTDLIYSPADYERRFLTGWWTRGVVPADFFVTTNWAGLIKPSTIRYDENEIVFEYPGRWWEDGCRYSTPPVSLSIQYLCKGGRLYLATCVKYGKKITHQIYAGHNGAQKFARIPLEKQDLEQCTIEKQADIPLSKTDIVELKHVADWIVTMTSASGVTIIGQPNNEWTLLFADYTETNLSWEPCTGCIFPTQNYSIPVVFSDDSMALLEARLALQNIVAIGETIILQTIPSTFNVPLCTHNTYLEVTLPELTSGTTISLQAVAHMRDYFTCDKDLTVDEYYSFPLQPEDILDCFIFTKPQNKRPDENDPRWKPECQASAFCRKDYILDNNFNTNATYISNGSSGTGGAIWKEGSFAANQPESRPRAFPPLMRTENYGAAPNGYTLGFYPIIVYKGIQTFEVRKVNGVCQYRSVWTVTKIFEQWVLLISSWDEAGPKPTPNPPGYDEAIANRQTATQLKANLEAASLSCASKDPVGNFPNFQPPERKEDNPCDGNCYVRGNFTIDLAWQVRRFVPTNGGVTTPGSPLALPINPLLNPKDFLVQLFRERLEGNYPANTPESNMISLFNTTIKIPFTFCLPEGSATAGDFTVGISGATLSISWKGKTITADLTSLLGAYNEAQMIVESVNPRPFSITDLETIC